MTVKELKEALAAYPDDMEVCYDCDDFYGEINYMEPTLELTKGCTKHILVLSEE